MRDFILGFFVSATLGLSAYIYWESVRHVPVVIKQVPVPVQMIPNPASDIETWDT